MAGTDHSLSLEEMARQALGRDPPPREGAGSTVRMVERSDDHLTLEERPRLLRQVRMFKTPDGEMFDSSAAAGGHLLALLLKEHHGEAALVLSEKGRLTVDLGWVAENFEVITDLVVTVIKELG